MATAVAPSPQMTTLTPAGIDPDAWQAAVADAYAKAQRALPEANGRLERALTLVQSGAVEHLAQFGAHHYTVASESDPSGLTTYDVHSHAPATCTCEDFERQSRQDKACACKHILGVRVYTR